MKKFRERCGAALLEVLISIAMMGLLMVPISSGILMSLHINEKSDEILQARLAVSSAVETIMAVGVENYTASDDLTVTPQAVTNDAGVIYWNVNVSHTEYEDISVDVYIRGDMVRTPETEGGVE